MAHPTPKDVYKLLGVRGPTPKDVYKLLGVRGPTPKDVYKLLGVQGPTPKDVYTLLGHSGGNLGVLGGLDGQFHEKTGTTTPYKPRNQGARHAASPPPVPLLLCYLYALATSHDVSRKIPVTRIPSDVWVVPESRVGST